MPDVTYPAPEDPERFKGYYEATHVPLAKQLPGLKSCSFGYPAALGPGGSAVLHLPGLVRG